MRVESLSKAVFYLVPLLSLLNAGVVQAVQLRAPTGPPRTVDFVLDVYPIFERSCHSCHGSQQQLGRLRLGLPGADPARRAVGKGHCAFQSLRESALSTGGWAERSGAHAYGGTLRDEEIELIRAWIEQGAEWPEGVGKQASEVPRHWAFVAPERVLSS